MKDQKRQNKGGPSKGERPKRGGRSRKEEESPKRKRRGDPEDKEELSENKGFKFKSTIIDVVKDFIIALVIIVILIISLVVYTGTWPPLVVVESNSMMHDDDSMLSAIDTGDMVLVKTVDPATSGGKGVKEICTWVEGKYSTGEKHYGTYGDVIIFTKNGNTKETPVIHRAVLWLEANYTEYNEVTKLGTTYDVPFLGPNGGTLYAQTDTITVPDYPGFKVNGKDIINLKINLDTLLSRAHTAGKKPLSGYITKGDHNEENAIDQLVRFDGDEEKVDPIRPQWIKGKAQLEIPWYGLIKLRVTGKLTERNPAPRSSWIYLFLSLGIIIVSVFLIDFCIAFGMKYYKKKKGKTDENDEEGSEKGKKEPEKGKRGSKLAKREPRGKEPSKEKTNRSRRLPRK